MSEVPLQSYYCPTHGRFQVPADRVDPTCSVFVDGISDRRCDERMKPFGRLPDVTEAELPDGYCDAFCDERNEVHRVAINGDIPFAICPHTGRREVACRRYWSQMARDAYDGMDRRLGGSKGGGLDDVHAAAFQVDLTPADSIPSSWWQHLKLALQTRWPRAFGWLVVRWRR